MTHGVPTEAQSRIRRLIGVYNAKGTLLGELAYLIGAKIGRAHCSLCDITHGGIREGPEWTTIRDGLGLPFDTFHLDEQPAVRDLLHGTAPAALVETDGGLVLLLGPDELAAGRGPPSR